MAEEAALYWRMKDEYTGKWTFRKVDDIEREIMIHALRMSA
jgi:hypothetical protein